MSGMKLGPRGEALIKSFETLRLEAYLPIPEDKPTIGWGHTRDVKMGDVATREIADILFRQDVAWVEGAVNRLGIPLTQSMFDALCSLVFNAGEKAINSTSTIGHAVATFSGASSYFTIWVAFTLWRKQAGKDMLGLARRRARDMQLFLEDGLPK